MRTPRPSVDVVALVPGLARYASTATRLHPRRRGAPSPDASHIGGPVRWPADEPWPHCFADLPGEGEKAVPQLDGTYRAMRSPPRFGARALPHHRPNPMIVVCALRAADVPDLWCPPDADLLQVLWCPWNHSQDHGSTPTVRLFWRRDDPSMPIAEPPVGTVNEDLFVPAPCVLHPEQITEYPDSQDLPPDLAAAVGAVGDGRLYDAELSTAPGWKAGGWPAWTDEASPRRQCGTCGATMRLLLTIDSSEHDGGRWQPAESGRRPDQDDDAEPTDVVVGRWANLHVFVCPTCPDAPSRPLM